MAVRGASAEHGRTERGSCVFDESKLPDVVRLLERREASLWHACQLLDLAAYLRLGGIASGMALARRVSKPSFCAWRIR